MKSDILITAPSAGGCSLHWLRLCGPYGCVVTRSSSDSIDTSQTYSSSLLLHRSYSCLSTSNFLNWKPVSKVRFAFTTLFSILSLFWFTNSLIQGSRGSFSRLCLTSNINWIDFRLAWVMGWRGLLALSVLHSSGLYYGPLDALQQQQKIRLPTTSRQRR